ncbi:MAG TPA: MFS transporter, partial [Burkholderiaceae bacterium]|nr:MFS transporter [Burkholderiaceae bacterium]
MNLPGRLQLGVAGGVRALFLTYFAFIGALSPYAALYFAARGLSIVEIGVLMSLPQALRIFAPAFWAWLADRSGKRVVLLRVSAAVAVATMLLFPAAASAPGFAALMLVLFFATAAQLPIAEAMALHVARGDAGRYGRLRLWGSIGFIGAVLLLGPLLDRWGVVTLPWLLAA